MKISIGIDSVDSQYGGCTTHVLYRIFKRLVENGYIESVLDYPYLVRLNPSIPHKTRGNGAVAINLELKKIASLDTLIDEVASVIVEYVNGIHGDLMRVCAAIVPYELSGYFNDIYVKALTDFVHLDYVSNFIKPIKDKVILPFGLNKGCVGALAALGWDKSRCSYELLIYRPVSHTEADRKMCDSRFLAELDSLEEYRTFCNYDYEGGRAVSVPHGPDPVLLGIRGLDPDKLVKTLKFLKLSEVVEGWCVFKTNQATGAHMVPRASHELKPFRTGCLTGVVKHVSIRPGGDVVLSLTDGFGEIDVAVFKESGLTRYVRQLTSGDVIRACGSVKLWDNLRPVLHVELLEIVDLADKYLRLNPRCPRCGARMKSSGRNKGYKCLKCGFKAADLRPETLKLLRDINTGLYLPTCGSVKHLSIPASLLNTPLDCYAKPPTVVSDFYSQ
ncbi:MAG: tRNA(Ile)(2)-agmatinylcytidine synthase [Desulfurococcaceae archaeon]